ncbi:MAG TPA: hypothetical protein VGO64_10500 [Candidatus Limnocylindrales bacterium]|nr:hypothetical protein [Candidatus Limnocylindrales bacterium]
MDALLVLVGPLVAIVLLDLLALHAGVDSRDQHVDGPAQSMAAWAASRGNR